MTNFIYQAKSDGTLIIDKQYEKLNDFELKEVLEKSLINNAWHINFISQEGALLNYSLFANNIIIKVYIYLLNVRSSGRGRAKEQRIQLNSKISNTGFTIEEKSSAECYVIGIYSYDDSYIFCAWDSKKKNNRGKQKSCYISIETIAKARRDGFASRKDSVGDIVCAFKPEFLHYYLVNNHILHTMCLEKE